VDRVPDDRVRDDGGQVPVVLPVPGDELHVLHAVRDDDGGADPQHRDRHGAVVPHLHLLERLLRLHHRERDDAGVVAVGVLGGPGGVDGVRAHVLAAGGPDGADPGAGGPRRRCASSWRGTWACRTDTSSW